MDFKTTPLGHQADEWTRSRADETRAIFWQPGLGKTKLALDTAQWLYLERKIDCLFVIAPNGVHVNWIADECPKHVQDPFLGFDWHSRRSKTKAQRGKEQELLNYRDGLAIVAMSYDGFMTRAGRSFADRIISQRDCLLVLDESTRIKSPNAKRTKALCAFGRKVKYKRILTGTPAHNSPFDLYSQIKFLDWDYWKGKGFSTFASFKSYFGIFERIEVEAYGGKKRAVDIVIGYRNLPKLKEIVEPIASRVTKDEALDLPAKLYSKRYFDLSDEQRSLYRKIKEEFIAFLDGEMVTAPLIITRMLRLQQICCGFLPTDDETLVRLGKNPRLDSLEEWMEDLDHQAIIWCRFREDVRWILERRGKDCVEYYGPTPQEQRWSNVEVFQRGDKQFFVGTPKAAGVGLTLHAAKSVMFYSNDFSLEDREQAEDRAHRIGQEGILQGGKHGVLYVDMIGWGTIDTKIVQALRTKLNLASQVTGDEIRACL